MNWLRGAGLICAAAMIDFLPNDSPASLRPSSEDISASLQLGQLIFLLKKKEKRNTFIDPTALTLVSSPVLSI